MNSNYLILPILFPLITSIILMFFWFSPKAQRKVSILGHIIGVIAAGILLGQVFGGTIITTQAGNWAAPFGITFVADALSGILVLLTSLVGLAVGFFSNASIKSNRASFGYYPLLHFLQMGLYGSFLAGDIFNLYVWFEVIIIASFALITLGGEKAQLEGAIKYVTMNLVASVIFLTGIAVLYGVIGSLNLADLSVKVAESPHKGLISSTAMLFLVGFGIKSAVFPMYFWLPDSYHTPPAAISAIFGGLLTKVGVYAMFRVFSLLFIADPFLREVLVWMAVLTMISGAFGAIVSHNLRKIFSYLIVSHIGFMIGGLALFTPLAVAGAVYYMIHDIIAKTNVFMISGLIFKLKGNFHINRLSGLYNERPVLSILFAVALFSIVGTPPLSGFWPKVMLLKGAAVESSYWLIFAILLASFLTLWAVVRMWDKVFWRASPKEETVHVDMFSTQSKRRKSVLLLPVILLVCVSLFIGFGVQPMTVLCQTIAEQLTDNSAYINAVLGPDLLLE